LIKQYTQGLSSDPELEEDYLDWFFLSHFGKGQGYWKGIPDDKLSTIMILEGMKEQEYWDNWVKIIKQIFK